MNQWFLAALAFALAIYLGLFSAHIAEDSYYPAGAVAFIRTNHLPAICSATSTGASI